MWQRWKTGRQSGANWRSIRSKKQNGREREKKDKDMLMDYVEERLDGGENEGRHSVENIGAVMKDKG